MSLINFLTSIEEVIDMEPEELAPLLLKYLKSLPADSVNRNNITSCNDREIYERLGNDQNKHKKLTERLMEAWMWLEREGLVLPKPGQNENWSFITNKGDRLVKEDNFESYKKANLFPKEIDPVLLREVRPLFARGDYDTAVFRAFKEVEVRVRIKGELADSDYGIDLMKRAFGPGGPLENAFAPQSERDRLRDLFVGSIGTFKNPSSHREVQFDDPREVTDIICLANQLLRIIGRMQ